MRFYRLKDIKTDFTNHSLSKYLIKLSPLVDEADEKIIGSYFHVLNDIERVGDHAENFYEIGIQMKELGMSFSQSAKEELASMYEKTLLFQKVDHNDRKGLLCSSFFHVGEKFD